MPIDDPAAVHTFIKIMVTSYMDSVSNRPDFIFLTCGHYLYHDNLLPASERHRTVFFFFFNLFAGGVYRLQRKILYTLDSVCVSVCVLHFGSVSCTHVCVCLHECTSIYSSSPP